MRRGLRDGQVAGAEPLSNTQVKEIQRWLEEKGVQETCELCKHDDEGWVINDLLLSVVAIASIETEAWAHRPFLTVHCANCGHIRMFDPWVILGT